MLIKPCCCHKDLPALLSANRDKLVVAQSYGDVPFETLYHAVAYLVTGSKQTLTVITPEVTIHLLRYVKQCFDRGWVGILRLQTAADQSSLVKSELGEYWKHTICAHSPQTDRTSALIILQAAESVLAISGYIPPQPLDSASDARLTHHSILHAYLGADGNPIYPEARQHLYDLTYLPLAPLRLAQAKAGKAQSD